MDRKFAVQRMPGLKRIREWTTEDSTGLHYAACRHTPMAPMYTSLHRYPQTTGIRSEQEK